PAGRLALPGQVFERTGIRLQNAADAGWVFCVRFSGSLSHNANFIWSLRGFLGFQLPLFQHL
ncbi:MAG TPA: hypothetical protein VE961_13610, partial [Pyrinomonadaceae bacterium]|nr:hypothetical protein [Pyrinomonadaceae bacterium]